ncbi:MAG TPA: heat-shock protein Hsp20, partial [Ignavibacteriales bacterium]|nr:heat-shock protein Hsp20 [Ignavibacteriales bacterium]
HKVQRFFGEFPSSFNYNNTFLPKIDISEDEKNIYFEAEIPGIKKEDVHISLEDNILTIKGEKKLNEDKNEKTLIRNERIYGSFTRSFTLHEEINPDTANAEFENGILKIVLEKAIHKAVKERQIQIK